MTLKYFRRLSEPNQFKRLILKGVCIAERSSNDALYLLFALDDFYVELELDRQSDQILTTRSFEGSEGLGPYLEDIPIPQPS